MKSILIAGANSYIGMSFAKYLNQWPEQYLVQTIDMIGDAWQEHDFSKYDAVFHIAGIAHIRETVTNADLFYRVNRDLAAKTAKIAKEQGIKQFIYLSSMSVYENVTGMVTRDTEPHPKSNYGQSKLQAESILLSMSDQIFKVAIVRPPMVYGKGCKGNYQSLSRIAKILPFFPNYVNKRSMIYIDNLMEFIRLLIEKGNSGIYMPQNESYITTSKMVQQIASAHGKRMCLVKLFNPTIYLLKKHIHVFNKVFGDLYYDLEISEFSENYRVCNLIDSITRTEI